MGKTFSNTMKRLKTNALLVMLQIRNYQRKLQTGGVRHIIHLFVEHTHPLVERRNIKPSARKLNTKEIN